MSKATTQVSSKSLKEDDQGSVKVARRSPEIALYEKHDVDQQEDCDQIGA